MSDAIIQVGGETIQVTVGGAQGPAGPDTADMMALMAAPGGSALVGYQNPLGAPAIQRLLRSRLGETVSALDYVAGNGSTDDAEAYQALVNLQPAEIVYPQGCEIATTQQILWMGDMTHRFLGDAGITADVASFGVRALGFPDLLVLTAGATISRGAVSFDTTTSPATAGLAIGDDFYLYDTVTEEYDINRVRAISGNTVYTKWPINYAFATAGNIQVYKLLNACRNVKVFGGTIRNVNASLSAGGLSFFDATDCSVDGLTALDTGGIGLEFNVALRCFTRDVAAISTGGVGCGYRNVKGMGITGFTGRNPHRDESLTFYKNCAHINIHDIDIEQYLDGEEPAGNAGLAGNCILFDQRITDVVLDLVRLRGSATYAIYAVDSCERITLDNFNIAQANLGGIRLGVGCNDSTIKNGSITDIVDAVDSEQAGSLDTAAIQDEAGTTGNVLDGGRQSFTNIAGGINIRRRGSLPSITGTVRGAMVRKAADQTAADYSAAPVIAWDAEVYDTDAIHDNSTDNSRFTVPPGASSVEIGCNLNLADVDDVIYSLSAKKNGALAFDGACAVSGKATSNTVPDVSIRSGPVPVAPGDYFEWQFYCADASITVVAARSNAWMKLVGA